MSIPSQFLDTREVARGIRAKTKRARHFAATTLKRYPDAARRVLDYAQELEKFAPETEAMERGATHPLSRGEGRVTGD